jgi:hypothetical protein
MISESVATSKGERMIIATYKGQKVQLVAGKKGAVYAKVGGVIVATDCKTAQEAQASARRFIDELEAGGGYSVTPQEDQIHTSEAAHYPLGDATNSDGIEEEVSAPEASVEESGDKFVEVSGRKKGGK